MLWDEFLAYAGLCGDTLTVPTTGLVGEILLTLPPPPWPARAGDTLVGATRVGDTRLGEIHFGPLFSTPYLDGDTRVGDTLVGDTRFGDARVCESWVPFLPL